jgi:hypothetical protein
MNLASIDTLDRQRLDVAYDETHRTKSILRQPGVERRDYPCGEKADEGPGLEADDCRAHLSEERRHWRVTSNRLTKWLYERSVRFEILLRPGTRVNGEHIGGWNDPKRCNLLHSVLGQTRQFPELLCCPGLYRLTLTRQMSGYLGGQLPIDRARLVEELKQLREEVVTHLFELSEYNVEK